MWQRKTVYSLFILWFVDHKIITCENKTDGTTSTKYINNTTIAGTTKDNKYNAVTFDVKAGKTYQVYTNGGTRKIVWYSI